MIAPENSATPCNAFLSRRKAALRRHKIWIVLNLLGMCGSFGLSYLSDAIDPDAYCMPGPLGGTGLDMLGVLIFLMTWLGNGFYFLVGMLTLKGNSWSKRLSLLTLSLAMPLCWLLFGWLSAHIIAAPDCCALEGNCPAGSQP